MTLNKISYFALLGAFFLALGLNPTARAQVTTNNRESSDQVARDITHPAILNPEYNEPKKIPDLKDILKNIHGGYSLSLMGPRLEGASNETYNIYLPDVSSIQLYHSFRLGYQVSDALQIGVNENIVHNLADGIRSPSGSVYNHSFEWYDPNIYFNLPKLIQIPGWFVFTSASFSLPIGEASQNEAKITSIIVQQSWTKSSLETPWSYGLNLYFNPQFYNDPLPSGFVDRQTLSLSFGPKLGYRVSPTFALSSSVNFDVEHRAPDKKGALHLGEGLPDYFKIGATVFPQIYPLLLSFGGYFQSLIWNPAADTSIVGANFSIGF